jgi:starch synthase (maltosyl-transferring)
LEEGRRIVESARDGSRVKRRDKPKLNKLLSALNDAKRPGDRLALLMSEDTAALLARAGERTNLTEYDRVLEVFVDRERAAFSAWYEMMPRSQSGSAKKPGTFDDVIARLPYVRDLGFDVLYFPPIHPIGRTNRKGRNNTLVAQADDPGSPYAIGADEGGHDAIHPELGTFEDFHRLVAAARDEGLEIALDFAIQCSPDHPWIKEHPEWFDWRPDGTIKFAENPPKKYEDIVNVHFYRDALPGVWHALRDIVLFWIDHGVKIFRVDNPHTKPFPFWEWMIAEVRRQHPDVIFLSEAFTRPKVMKRLAKLGFTQSYSYFTWRNTKAELQDYLIELTQSDCRHYMRPNFFTNTPDINPFYLQSSGRAGFQVRLVLAGTLAGNYGIYNGFELCEAEAVPGREEYLNSEKYEIRAWDWDRPGHIREDIRLINDLRRKQPALRQFTNLSFYNAWNDDILYYGKRTPDLSNFLLFAVNLDPHNPQEAHFEVPLWEFGLPDEASIEVEDLVTGHHFTWHGKVQHLALDPQQRPYAIWRLIPPGAARR